LPTCLQPTVSRSPEGAQLIGRGDVDRATRDLGYFATRPEHVLALMPHLIEALTADGLIVEVQRSTVGFARLIASDPGHR
jgi:hypothetical protein